MKNIFKNIGSDKYMHFGVCAIVALLVGLFGIVLNMTPIMVAYCGFIAAMGAGLGKEYGDKVNPNNRWDWKDVLADFIGAVVGSGIVLVAALLF